MGIHLIEEFFLGRGTCKIRVARIKIKKPIITAKYKIIKFTLDKRIMSDI